MGRVVPRRVTDQFCHCIDHWQLGKGGGWRLNPSTGKWVHRYCGKPSKPVPMLP